MGSDPLFLGLMKTRQAVEAASLSRRPGCIVSTGLDISAEQAFLKSPIYFLT
jgi:hypothetical protein